MSELADRALVALVTGVTEDTYQHIKQANEHLSSSEGEAFKREMLKAASKLLRIRDTELSNALSHRLSVMSKTAAWSIEHDEVAEHIESALARTKTAASPSLPAGLAQTLMWLPLLGGGTLGALAFGLNKGTKHESNDNEALKAKIRYYDSVTSELENTLSKKYRQEAAQAGML